MKAIRQSVCTMITMMMVTLMVSTGCTVFTTPFQSGPPIARTSPPSMDWPDTGPPQIRSPKQMIENLNDRLGYERWLRNRTEYYGYYGWEYDIHPRPPRVVPAPPKPAPPRPAPPHQQEPGREK
jgi:hypothetical protein